jgi:hypothetical protein
MASRQNQTNLRRRDRLPVPSPEASRQARSMIPNISRSVRQRTETIPVRADDAGNEQSTSGLLRGEQWVQIA